MDILKEAREFGLAFVFAVLFLNALAFLVNTDMPLMSVYSGSMLPILHRGDMIFLVGAAEPKVGDIIVYEFKKDYPIVHRIIEIRDGGYVMKGDANPVTDQQYFGTPPVTKSQVKGKVILGAPMLGYPKLALDYVVSLFRQ